VRGITDPIVALMPGDYGLSQLFQSTPCIDTGICNWTPTLVITEICITKYVASLWRHIDFSDGNGRIFSVFLIW